MGWGWRGTCPLWSWGCCSRQAPRVPSEVKHPCPLSEVCNVPSEGKHPCPLGALLSPRGPCRPLGHCDGPSAEPRSTPAPTSSQDAEAPQRLLGARRELPGEGRWDGTGRDGAGARSRREMAVPAPATGLMNREATRGSQAAGARPRGGRGTQVPGLPFPGRPAVPALGAVAMVWTPGRLLAWTRRPRWGPGGSAARGTVWAAGFAGPERAGGARRPRGRRFPAGRSAAAGWGAERSGAAGGGGSGGARRLRRESGDAACPGPAWLGSARPDPAPPAGHDRGPGAAGEALTRSPRRGGRGVGAWPLAVAGALSLGGASEGPRVCRRAAGRPAGPPGPEGSCPAPARSCGVLLKNASF